MLVAAAIFQLVTGLANAAQWYPWHFNFRPTHYALAWIAIGALVVHVAVKLPIIRTALTADVDSTEQDRPDHGAGSRRDVAPRTAADHLGRHRGGRARDGGRDGAAGCGRSRCSGVRSGDGPEGVPINHSAATAASSPAATSAAYRLTVAYGDRQEQLSLADLRAMPQTTASLPIACVEGWSAGATWTGVPVRDLLDLRRRAGRAARCSSSRCRSTAASGSAPWPATSPTIPHTLAGARPGRGSRCRSTTASRAG